MIHTIVTASDTSCFDTNEYDYSIKHNQSLNISFLVFERKRKLVKRPDGTSDWNPLYGEEKTIHSCFLIAHILEYHVDGTYQELNSCNPLIL